MSFGERGGYKPPEELKEQIERAETTLGNKPEHSLVPPSKKDATGGTSYVVSICICG